MKNLKGGSETEPISYENNKPNIYKKNLSLKSNENTRPKVL